MTKNCERCNQPFRAVTTAKYCPDCRETVYAEQNREAARRQNQRRKLMEQEKPFYQATLNAPRKCYDPLALDALTLHIIKFAWRDMQQPEPETLTPDDDAEAIRAEAGEWLYSAGYEMAAIICPDIERPRG